MMLFTTYLGFLNKIRDRGITVEVALENLGLKNPKVYYVMRNRGNNEVAPGKEALMFFRKFRDWKSYKKWYLKGRLETEEAKEWMKKVAEEAVWRDVVLVCFEKDHIHCHRVLLAHTIAEKFPEVNYVGELRSKAMLNGNI